MVGLSMPVPNFQFGVVIGSQVVVAQGAEIDIVKAIADRLGIPQVSTSTSPGFLPIVNGRPKPYDLAIAEATITPERERRVDFSMPYMRADQGVLMARQYHGAAAAARWPQLRRLRLCSGRGTTGAAAIRNHVRPLQPPLLLENQRRVFDALRRGRCAAAVYDAPILAAVKAAYPTRLRQAHRAHPDQRALRHRLRAGLAAAAARRSGAARHARPADGCIASATAGWASPRVSCRCCARHGTPLRGGRRPGRRHGG